MKAMKILGFSIISLIMVCGCVGNGPPVQKISDDDLYLQNLNDYASLSDAAQPQSGNQFTQEQVIATELKNRSTLFYNRVTPLTVSSKFENSKTSFLQALKEGDALADYYLSLPSDGRSKIARVNSLTAAEKAQYMEASDHDQKFLLFLISAYDSNVCSAAGDTYTNITTACKSFYNVQFFRYYQIL
jgi:hypothetical protein